MNSGDNIYRKFRVDALSNVRSWEDIKKLLVDNKRSLEYLKEYEGLDHFLGSGAYGKVFKIKNENLTIKVTTDNDEIDGSAIIYRKGPTKRFINVYSIQIINDSLAIKIQDYLYTLTGKNVEAAKQLQKLYEDGFSVPSNGSRIEYMNYYDYLNKNAQRFLSELYSDYNKLDLTGFEFNELDVKAENLLQDRQGKLILADF